MQKMGRSACSCRQAKQALQAHAWPNVRELDNAIQRVLIMQNGHTLYLIFTWLTICFSLVAS